MGSRSSRSLTDSKPLFKITARFLAYNARHASRGESSYKVKWHVFLPLVALLAALAAGCAVQSVERAQESTGADEDGRAAQTSRNEATTSGAPLTAPGATVGLSSTTEQSEVPQQAPSPGSAGEEAAAMVPSSPFTEDPEADGGAGYGADSILAVRYGEHEGYKRVVIDLGTGQDPAGAVPEWTLSSPAGDGVLRINLPSVSSTGVSDGEFDGGLLEDFHVVHAPEGGMFVDIFAGSAFTYRVIEVLDPARLVVDFKPSADAELDVSLPVEKGNTVLTQPRKGARIEDPLTISGYSRNFEARNTITLTDSGGAVVVREAVQGNDWNSTWGYFETTLDLPDFEGQGTLRVGAKSPRDGTFEGVEIPVRGS